MVVNCLKLPFNPDGDHCLESSKSLARDHCLVHPWYFLSSQRAEKLCRFLAAQSQERLPILKRNLVFESNLIRHKIRGTVG